VGSDHRSEDLRQIHGPAPPPSEPGDRSAGEFGFPCVPLRRSAAARRRPERLGPPSRSAVRRGRGRDIRDPKPWSTHIRMVWFGQSVGAPRRSTVRHAMRWEDEHRVFRSGRPSYVGVYRGSLTSVKGRDRGMFRDLRCPSGVIRTQSTSEESQRLVEHRRHIALTT